MGRHAGLISLWIAVALALLLGGCSAHTRPPLPEDKRDRLEVLVAAIRDELPGDEPFPPLGAVSAALELRDLGLEYTLPQSALDALKEMEKDDSWTEGHVDFLPNGDGGSVVERTGNYAHLVFYTWEFNEIPTRQERIRFLWDIFVKHPGSPIIHNFCVTEWGKMCAIETVPYLFAATATSGDADWLARHKAAVALDTFYPAARPIFEVLCDSPDTWIAHHAREVLVSDKSLATVTFKNGDEESLATHLDDNQWLVRRAAVARLAKFRSRVAVKSVIGALRDPDPLVRQAAASALGKMGDKRAAAHVEEAAVEPPLTEAALKDESALTRLAALQSLRQVVVYVPLDVLEQATQDEDADVRNAAVKMTAAHGSPDAVTLLIRTLKGGSDQTRSIAAEALGSLHAAEAVPNLIAVLKASASGYVVSRYSSSADSAAKALGEIRDVRAVPALIDRLNDKSPYLQQLCAEALGKIGDRRAIEPLEALVERHRYGLIRAAAEKALADIKTTRTAP